jgi:hypothetical protein
MSVKAMGLCWDLLCPNIINYMDFRPNHKYILVAYADHADHNGRNIYPSVQTISEKTGLDDRTVQRMTRDLESMGLLIEDGQGPRGTNRWKLPYNQKGDSLTPVTVTGVKNDKSLGDSPSGDNPSGDTVPPEFKELNLSNIYISKEIEEIWVTAKSKFEKDLKRATYETWVRDTVALGMAGRILVVAVRNQYARDWLDKNILVKAQEITGQYVAFVVQTPELEDA